MRDALRHRLAAFRALAQWAGAAVSLVGCLVLVGWVFDLPLLKSLSPSLATMKVNTAFGLVLAGLALWSATAEQVRQWQGRLKQGGALLAGLIGALTLSEYLFGVDLGIDQLVFQDAAISAEFPGRMSPATALNFLLIGIALLVLDRQRLLAQVLVLAVALVSLLALAGYLYGVPALYGISPYSTMALHTALGFLLLCAGVLAARPERGFAAILVSETLGGKLARRLLPAVVGVPLGLGWLCLEGERQGLYEMEFGLALFAVVNAVVLAALSWWSAQRLQKEEAERQGAQERFQRLFDAAPDAIVLADSQGHIVRANTQVGPLFGYQPEELYGQPEEVLMPERYRARHQGHRLGYMAEPRMRPMGTMEVYGQRKDGSEVPVEISLSPLETQEGLLVISAIRDITERRQAEAALHTRDEELRAMTQQLWQAAKLATVGELAASIAHELNNPLATISLRVEGLVAQVSGPAQQALEVVAQEVERMARLVENLLNFSRHRVQQISSLDLRQEIDNTLELIQFHLRNHGIELARDFAPELPLIQADRQQVRQLLLNLFTNASDAMPQGGTLTVRVQAAAAGVAIEITDTGVGIAPEDLPKIMEPFFTTKPEGKGTGLGLAICRRVVQEHGGIIELQSELGKGTTVRVVFSLENGKNTGQL